MSESSNSNSNSSNSNSSSANTTLVNADADRSNYADYSNADDNEVGDEASYIELANSFKERGNEAFKQGRYADAVKLYSQGIEIDPDNVHLLSNRYLLTQ